MCGFVIATQNMTQLTYFRYLQEDGGSVASSVETLPENEAVLREMLGSLPEKAEGW